MLTPSIRLFDEAGDSGSGGGGTSTLLAAAAAGTPPAGNGNGAPPPAGAINTKPWTEGWVGAEGKLDKTAYDRLPDHLKPYRGTFEKYDSLEKVMMALGHAESLVGKKGLMPLPANASEADRAEFRKRLAEVQGVPEKPDGYGLTRPDTIPEELWNQKYVEGVSAIAHKHAISPTALKELFEYHNKVNAEDFASAQAAQVQAEKEAVEGLKKELGAKFDDTLRAAVRAAKTYGLDIEDPIIGSRPDVIKMLAAVANAVGEDKLVTGNAAGAGPTAAERIHSIMNMSSDPMYKAYRDPNDPQHKAATDLVLRLTQEEVAQRQARR